MSGFVVAIVGRPNVGKSALFNRLLQKRIAIVDKMSGVTRDRIYGPVEWQGCRFTLIDTGGVDLGSTDNIKQKVFDQVSASIGEAQVVLLVTDVAVGVMPMDYEVSSLLRRQGKQVIVVVNKVDGNELLTGMDQFYRLGWPKVIGVSVMHGLGIDILLDIISADMPKQEMNDLVLEETDIKTAVIGRPNVGKSTLINALAEQERVIVDERPGTTRDAIDVRINRNKKSWLFIDTGGMRKKKSLESSVEFYSSRRAYISIKRSDVVIIMADGREGIKQQEAKLLDYITEQGKGCVIAVNKWDLVTGVSRREYLARIYQRLERHSYVPVVFISALKKDNIGGLLELLAHVFSQTKQEVTTPILNRVLKEAVSRNRPALVQGKPLRIYYGTQIGVAPPRFVLFVNDPRRLQKIYLGYLINRLRAAFGFEGVPLVIKLQKRREG